jgi:hypothetical protein
MRFFHVFLSSVVVGWVSLVPIQASTKTEVVSRAYPYSAIGMLTISASDGSVEGYCSGTLVGPDLVLTAAHCFERNGRIRHEVFQAQTYQGKKKAVISYPLVFEPNLVRDGNSSARHPSFKETIFGTLIAYRWDVSRGQDWALVRLNQQAGETLGYLGVLNIKGVEASAPFRREQNAVGYHGGAEVGYAVELSSCEITGRGGPGVFSAWKNFMKLSCTFGRDEGASGGPLMVRDGSLWSVTGVLTGYKNVPWPYRSESYFSDLSEAAGWIEKLR